MHLPKSKQKLEEIFKNAPVAEISDLEGEYYVDMLTGILPSIRRFSHRKVFCHENKKITGCNIVFKNFKWGNFFVEKSVTPLIDKDGSGEVLVINYDHPKNSFLTNKIRDHIRCIKKRNAYIGRFNYLLNGKLYFLGYFSLLKK